MPQSEIAWCWAGREVSAGKAKAMVMESLSRAMGSHLPFAACWAGGACTAFPTKGRQQSLEQAPGPLKNLCCPGCQPALGTLEHR